MEWQVEGIKHLLAKFTLFGASLPFTSQGDVIQLETQDLSQDCLYTSRGWNTLPVSGDQTPGVKS